MVVHLASCEKEKEVKEGGGGGSGGRASYRKKERKEGEKLEGFFLPSFTSFFLFIPLSAYYGE